MGRKSAWNRQSLSFFIALKLIIVKKYIMKKHKLVFVSAIVLISIFLSNCNFEQKTKKIMRMPHSSIVLSQEQAVNLAQLPLKCIGQEYPNKLNQTLQNETELAGPKALHPAFYGCFDWHSSVHGHWMLVKLLKLFPEVEIKDQIISGLKNNITKENILLEIEYFDRAQEKSFERTYGWAWLLKLTEELYTWDKPLGKELYENLLPLTNLIVDRYIDFLPRLNYPIRVGEHTNTAFGLTFAFDYAKTCNHEELKSLITKRAREYYMTDENCPLTWEPSGFDFLSPCLEEADLMRRVLSADEFEAWLKKFLPAIVDQNFALATAIVSDRSDGKLVHLDGLNFSRAWCLNGIANEYEEYGYLKAIADKHIESSLSNVAQDSYEGGHWLASFALYALDSME